MNSTEKIVIKTATSNLISDTYRSWIYGDIDEWKEYALKLKNSIINNTNILNSITEDTEKEDLGNVESEILQL